MKSFEFTDVDRSSTDEHILIVSSSHDEMFCFKESIEHTGRQFTTCEDCAYFYSGERLIEKFHSELVEQLDALCGIELDVCHCLLIL